MRKRGSIYTLTEPCANCPFRIDRPFYLGRERRQEIADDLEGGATFYCHKTLDYNDEGSEVTSRSRACAGSLIAMEKDEAPNQIMRIAERLGLYDRTKLNMDAPVVDSLQDFADIEDV